VASLLSFSLSNILPSLAFNQYLPNLHMPAIL
jgi:hypothetical protein